MPLLLLVIVACTLAAAAVYLPAAIRAERAKILWVLAVPLPWIIEIVLGQTHQFNRIRHGPEWVGIAFEAALWANPAVWLAAFLLLRKARPFVASFVVVNVFIALLATIVASCDFAGACF